jgi:hypothetical protein
MKAIAAPATAQPTPIPATVPGLIPVVAVEAPCWLLEVVDVTGEVVVPKEETVDAGAAEVACTAVEAVTRG